MMFNRKLLVVFVMIFSLVLSASQAFSAKPPSPPGKTTPATASTVDIADYTAFPPFLPRVISPNILFLLDYSSSMVSPAYGECTSEVSDCRNSFFIADQNYDSTVVYPGYFDSTADYSCTAGGSCNKTVAADAWNGNWLNWLTMTQFDVLKKAVVGGDVTPAPEQGNPGKIQSVLPAGVQMYKVAKYSDCTANAPDAVCGAEDPQVIPYNWINTPGAVTPLASGNFDAATGVLTTTMPFDFDLDGTIASGSTITIDVNGYISLSDLGGSFYTANVDMPNAAAPNSLLAPYWDDASGKTSAGSSISAFTVGTAPNRIFVVTFESIVNDDDVGATNPLTYQVLFFEAGSQIVFQYKEVQPAQAFGAGKLATVGLENADASRFYKYSHLGLDGGGSPRLLTNNLALLMTPVSKLFYVTPGTGGAAKTEFSYYGSATKYQVYVDINSTAKVSGQCPNGYYINKHRDECYDHETEGLLQEFRDGELAGLLGFRLGIMQLNDEDGGDVIKHFNQKDETGWSSLMSATRNTSPTNNAPLAEALYEAQGYFKQDTAYRMANNDWTNHGENSTCASTGNNYDPYCFQSAAQRVPCVKNYVLLVSAGNYSHDNATNIYGDANAAESWSNNWALGWRSTGETAGDEGLKVNGGWLDNVAYELRTASKSTTPGDSRLAADLPGNQNVNLYVVNTFTGDDDGSAILQKAARFGGFIDADGDNVYDAGDCSANPVVWDEADKTCDGKPDTFFSASAGNIKDQIVNAVMDILKNSASGTSVSVLSTSSGGEGALYQAYFYPAKISDATPEETRWPGYLRSFFIDQYQNLRDDYSGGVADHSLVFNEDRIAQMYLDDSDNAVRVKLYNDTNGNGILETSEGASPVATVAMDDVSSNWEGGEILAKRDKTERNIYLWVDTDGDGVVDNNEGDFSSTSLNTGETLKLATTQANQATQAAYLKPYLRAGATEVDTDGDGIADSTWITAEQEAENLLDFVLGNQFVRYNQAYRNRCVSVGVTGSGCSTSGQSVWPLGDIVFSTPTLVTGPTERYDQIYFSSTYSTFRAAYKNRRHMIYVGANDGMLHAFNAGIFHEGDNSSTVGTVERGYFTANPSSGNGWTSPAPDLGDELWAFLPHDNLPHIAWLGCNGTANDPSVCGDSEYTHVYYADQRPKVTDVQIFNDTATSVSGKIDGQANVSHPNGWGTILILPLRLGGGAIDVDLNGDGDVADPGEQSFRSAYYALDITDPEKPPKLLWRFTDPALGFSNSYPAIVRIVDGATIKWFMVVGSGPDNNVGTGGRAYSFAETTQDGRIFVVDLENGSYTNLDADSSITGSQVMGDPSVVDVDFDFSSDVIYIGSAINPTQNVDDPSHGRLYRVNTLSDSDPAQWSVTTMFDADSTAAKNNPDPDNNEEMGPLLSGPAVAKDKSGNLWVYFGTGLYKNRGDITNSDQQRFFGIKDRCWKNTSNNSICFTSSGAVSTYEMGDLVDTSAVQVYNLSKTGTSKTQANQVGIDTGGSNDPCGGSSSCSYGTMLGEIRAKDGWYVDMKNPVTASERVLSKATVIGGVVLFTSYEPAADVCSIFGDSYLNALFYETGTAYTKAVLGTEQKGSEEVYSKKKSLGKGMPTSVGVAIGESTSGFVQKSTGEIEQIEAETPFKVKSDVLQWRHGSKGKATEVEAIYKHIVK